MGGATQLVWDENPEEDLAGYYVYRRGDGEFERISSLVRINRYLDQSVSDEYARKLIHAYYACISYVDHQIGRLLGELKTLGLAENTIVVIWGDHGWHLGDQRVWGKHTIFENLLACIKPK